MENVSIRAVKIVENKEVIGAFLEALHENERVLFDKTAKWRDIELNYIRHLIAMQQEQAGYCLLAQVGDLPVGFIFGYLEDEDDSRFEISVGEILYVSDGFVQPEYRNLGIYRKLNDQLESHFKTKGVKRMMRFTLQNNGPMKHFLDRQGYKVTRLLYEKWL